MCIRDRRMPVAGVQVCAKLAALHAVVAQCIRAARAAAVNVVLAVFAKGMLAADSANAANNYCCCCN
eukprot:4171175-Alexandrium_andersonii.AAC.1